MFHQETLFGFGLDTDEVRSELTAPVPRLRPRDQVRGHVIARVAARQAEVLRAGDGVLTAGF